jgi:hypothetical protein
MIVDFVGVRSSFTSRRSRLFSSSKQIKPKSSAVKGRLLQARLLQSDMSLTLALKLVAANSLVNSDGQIRNRQLNISLVHAVFQMPAKKRYFAGGRI